MARLWPTLLLIAIGLTLIVLAPSTQDCITWSDGQACDDGWSTILLGAGVATISASFLLLATRRARH